MLSSVMADRNPAYRHRMNGNKLNCVFHSFDLRHTQWALYVVQLMYGHENNAATEATGNEVKNKCNTLIIPFKNTALNSITFPKFHWILQTTSDLIWRDLSFPDVWHHSKVGSLCVY